MLINNSYIDAVVSYEDIVINYNVDVVKAEMKKNTGVRTVSIAVAVKEGTTLDKLHEIGKTRKILIMAEYVELCTQWVRKNGLVAKIEHVTGSAESYLVNDLCDACVVVCDSGTTLKENNLIVLDTLVTTSMHLFVSKEKLNGFTV